MFNWWGNHTIGIIGLGYSGKTVLLTSLLWHLDQYNHEDFPSKYGPIQNFELIRHNNEHDFKFDLYKNTLVQEHRWPEKTTDYAIADCKYILQEMGFFRKSSSRRHVIFVDIPGERVSDISMKGKNYREWVEELFHFWDNNPKLKATMESYRKLAEDSKKTLGELITAYKTAMWNMLTVNYCQITPSTYLLGTDGSQLGDENNQDMESAIKFRQIWDCGELLPLPKEWCDAHRSEACEMEKTFKKYNRLVLNPLFKKIDACDNFIFCVDIPGIINCGPACLNYTKQTFKDFIRYLAPNGFMQKLNGKKHKPRLAYVATKSDMIEDKDNLEKLLKSFNANIAGFEEAYFTCSACVSTDSGETLPWDKWPRFDSGRVRDDWKPGVYFPEVAPPKYTGESVDAPPMQINLDHIFDFVMEG